MTRRHVIERRSLLASATFAALAAGVSPWRRAVAQTGAVVRAPPAERSFGRLDAPVTVVEYYSLTCHHCATFHRKVLPQVTRAFVTPGLVHLVYRDSPIDRVTLDATALAHAAGSERHKAMLDVLFASQDRWAHASDPRAELGRFGALAGLTPVQIEACWNDRGFLDAILQMRLDGERLFKVSSTPSFVIADRLHPGSLSFERFSALVGPLLPPGTATSG